MLTCLLNNAADIDILNSLSEKNWRLHEDDMILILTFLTTKLLVWPFVSCYC